MAHHHVHKSKSTRLRYEINNLIPLCGRCHQRLHHNESFWASKIVSIKGVGWFERIDKIGRETVKADIYFYLSNYEKLKAMKDCKCDRKHWGEHEMNCPHFQDFSEGTDRL